MLEVKKLSRIFSPYLFDFITDIFPVVINASGTFDELTGSVQLLSMGTLPKSNTSTQFQYCQLSRSMV